uniref:Ig-like domain-containing protein n=1 Tax=Loa loa TaxID=7209 RepID=A0A1I7VCF3_LOALO
IGRDVVLSTWCGRRHQQIRWRTLNVTFVVHKIAGRSKILLQATVAETLGRNIQLPQTWVIKPSNLTSSFSYHCRAFNNHRFPCVQKQSIH